MKQLAFKEPKIFGLARKHKVALTTIVELAGFFGTVYLSCTEKTKAEKIIEENDITDTKEKVKVYAKTMWPAALTGAATSSIITYANVSAGNKIRELGSAALMYRNLRDEYEEAVRARIGDKKADQIDHDVAINEAERSDLHVKGIIDTGHGHELFYDPISGFWFYSSNQYVSRVALDFANRMAQKEVGYYSDFLESNDLPASGDIVANTVFIRDRESAYNVPSLKLEYGTCDENRHELTGEKYAVLTWCGNKPNYVDKDTLFSLDI